MFESIQPIIDSSDNNTRLQKTQRSLIGALYGSLAGTAFVLTSGFIDIFLYPDLPLGINWSLVAARWAWIGLGLGLIGALTSFFEEIWAGLLAGAVSASMLALVSALFSASTTAGIKVIVLVFTLVPAAAMSLPIAWTLRRLAEKHALALHLKQPALRIAILILIAVAFGAGFGSFAKMSRSELAAVRFLHEELQAARLNKISQLPGFQEHMGMEYKLFQKESEVSTEGYDVSARYADGYGIKCVVVVYPGSNPSLSYCESDEN
jgi:hypothetical protein